MANKINRRRSRAIAMELLYSGTVNRRDQAVTDEFLDDFASVSDTTEGLDKAYIRQVVELAEAREGHFRRVVTPFLKDWDIKRISRINRAILRVSVTELLYMKDIPPRVSVNEAIELTRTYSDEESTAFINAVLDNVLKAIQEGTIPEWTPELEEVGLEETELGDGSLESSEDQGTVEPASDSKEEPASAPGTAEGDAPVLLPDGEEAVETADAPVSPAENWPGEEPADPIAEGIDYGFPEGVEAVGEPTVSEVTGEPAGKPAGEPKEEVVEESAEESAEESVEETAEEVAEESAETLISAAEAVDPTDPEEEI